MKPTKNRVVEGTLMIKVSVEFGGTRQTTNSTKVLTSICRNYIFQHRVYHCKKIAGSMCVAVILCLVW
jgi:hypothetical protein